MSGPPPNLALKDLAYLVGDNAAREIVRLFLQSFPEAIRGLACGSRPDQLRVLHGLKSSALHMGADRLSEQIARIEDRLAQPGEKLGQADLDAATAEFDAFAAELRRYAEP